MYGRGTVDTQCCVVPYSDHVPGTVHAVSTGAWAPHTGKCDCNPITPLPLLAMFVGPLAHLPNQHQCMTVGHACPF
jgi:hypothetical protein